MMMYWVNCYSVHKRRSDWPTNYIVPFLNASFTSPYNQITRILILLLYGIRLGACLSSIPTVPHSLREVSIQQTQHQTIHEGKQFSDKRMYSLIYILHLARSAHNTSGVPWWTVSELKAWNSLYASTLWTWEVARGDLRGHEGARHRRINVNDIGTQWTERIALFSRDDRMKG